MTDVARLAIPAALFLTMAGVIFGIAMARWIWADDLQFAQTIEASRKQTDLIHTQIEASLRGQIDVQDQTIKTLKEHLKTLGAVE